LRLLRSNSAKFDEVWNGKVDRDLHTGIKSMNIGQLFELCVEK